MTHWQDICVYRSTATAAPSALSINNWFEPPKGSQGRCTCYKLEVVFPTQLKNCWIISCDTQMSQQDFWESVFYVFLCSKWVIVTFQFLKVKCFKRVLSLLTALILVPSRVSHWLFIKGTFTPYFYKLLHTARDTIISYFLYIHLFCILYLKGGMLGLETLEINGKRDDV